MRVRYRITVPGIALALVCGVIGWVTLAPVEIGGRSTYAIITGNSMEPPIRAGDLVILRRGDAYSKGDVVGYRDAGVRQIVLHRIIGRSGQRLTMRGDNNSFVDPTRPLEQDVVGRLRLRVPRLGSVLEVLRQPIPMALLAFLAVALLVPVGRRPRGER